mmetsp:Transcript_9715/g.58936  ORF Transcript_9715/g.58936 Transcript_9715/m.58936 type:complete len:147 (+) Transcript_9715:1093-1533(+)
MPYVARVLSWKSNLRVAFLYEHLLRALQVAAQTRYAYASCIRERFTTLKVTTVIVLLALQLSANGEVHHLKHTKPSSIFPAIVGGSPVNPPDKYPWIVYVGCVFKDTTQLLCPGTLISNEHILSAGQCNPSMFYHCSLSQIMIIFR